MSELTVDKLIGLLKEFAGRQDDKIELILVGGLSMAFYGGSRLTVDVDAEIKCRDRTYDDLTSFLSSRRVLFNIGDDISRWSIVPMPEGYRERTSVVHESRNLVIKILEPVDYVFAKLRRGTAEDLSDIREVLSRYKITRDQIEKRFRTIQLPKDTESAFFVKRYEQLRKELLP